MVIITALIFYILTITSCSVARKENFNSTPDPLVPTSSGLLHGKYIAKSKFEVLQFLGVPYAQPPVGTLRFQKPKTISTPEIQRDASKFAPTCVQMRHLSQAINPLLNVDEEHKTSEDCLFVNVYVPLKNGKKQTNLPIMVWLPGEGFDFADARQFDGTYLASLANVIVITVQYRVGVFGFLKTDSEAPGNMGIWDQLEALDWIKKNAKAFGGDSDNITLFGRFTGSMSISILLTSPKLRSGHDYDLPLFKRAILSSGIAVGNWVFENESQKISKKFLESIHCQNETLSCLHKVSVDEILEKASFGWKPTFDGELITEEPLEALKNGNFADNIGEVMFGINEIEGSLCLLNHFAAKTKYYDLIIDNKLTENDVMEMIQDDMKMFFSKNFDNNYHNKILISSIFNKNHNISLREKYMEFCSSLFIGSHMKSFNKLLVKRQLENQSKANMTLTKTFNYQFQHRPTFSIAPSFINSAIHGDDVLFAFGLAHSLPIIHDEDEKITNYFIKSLSNFAYYGNPNGRLNGKWSQHEMMMIKSDEFPNEKEVVYQTYLFSSTAEILLTFLTASTTVLALVTTSLILFLVVYMFKQRHSTLKKGQSLL